MSEIKIGDKVVCIDDTNWTNQAGIPLVYKNQYTLLDITICKTCNNVYYHVGCKRHDKTSFTNCCQHNLVGAGFDWVNSEKFVPYIITFKDYCRKEVIEQMQEDIRNLVKKKEYEKAIDEIKRLEKIYNEL